MRRSALAIRRTAFVRVAALLICLAVVGKAAELTVDFDEGGLRLLQYDGASLLAGNSAPSVHIRTAEASKDASPNRLSTVLRNETTAVHAYDGLTITTTMRRGDDRLMLDIAYENTGDVPLAQIEYRPAVMRFPRRPVGNPWKWGYDVTIAVDEAPPVLTTEWSDSKLLVCVDHQGRDQDAVGITYGYRGNYGNAPTNALFYRVSFPDLLAPGARWSFTTTWILADRQTPQADLVEEIHAAFRERFPYTLDWPDRRPIGALFMSRDNTGWETNPRGWFNEPKIDVTTEEGLADFQRWVMAYADRSIAVLKATGAQGIIVWDVEGQEMPHAISYLGDPRVLPWHAPEMDQASDAFFKRFLDAGFKTGVTIRPSRIVSRPNTGKPAHQQVDDAVADMSAKIVYAQERWGCTIFYMDTNVTWPLSTLPLDQDLTRGMWQGNATLLSSAALRELHRRHPDVLIVPEFGRVGYWSVCAPYGELRGGTTRTRDDVRQLYPQAGTVIAVADGDYAGRWNELRAGVMAGDVHLFRGWFGDPLNVFVERLHREAAYRQGLATLPDSVTIADLLSSDEPAKRYLAAARQNQGSAEQIQLLLDALQTETDWVVRRELIAALSRSAHPLVVPTLTELAVSAGDGLNELAIDGLATVEPPAVAALIDLSRHDKKPIVLAAVRALGRCQDAAALSALSGLATSGDLQVRTAAVRGLGGYAQPEAIELLLSQLSESNPQIVIAACRALGETKAEEAIPALVTLIGKAVSELRDNNIRLAAGDALEAITGLEHSVFPERWRRAYPAPAPVQP